MTLTRIAILSLTLTGVACATAGNTATSTATQVVRLKQSDGTVLVCEMELPTGSHIRERVCRPEEGTTATEMEARRQIFNRPAVQLTK